MNPRVILKLSTILSLSVVRAKRVKGGVPKGLAKSSRANLILSILFFFTFTFIGRNIFGFSQYYQLLAYMPLFLLFATLIYGLMFEFNQPYHVGSTDPVSWLPISAGEYVLSSELSFLYLVSPLFSVFLGATVGLAPDAGFCSLLVGLELASALIGLSLLEIIRALMNRVSKSLYRKSGRATLFARTGLSVAVIILFILISNLNFLKYVAEAMPVGSSYSYYLFPLWPSLAVEGYLSSDLFLAAMGTSLTLGLLAISFSAGVWLRAKYWFPAPVSIKLESEYRPGGRLFGLSRPSSAILRKDMRGLVRRKEMLGWLAVPIAIALTVTLTHTGQGSSEFIALLFGPVLMTFYLSVVGIGQEGKGFINLLSAPLGDMELVKPKLASAIIPSALILFAILSLYQFLAIPRPELTVVACTVGLSLIFEASAVGLAFGIMYPDFTEIPRARFVTQKGLLLSMLSFLVVASITCFPLFLHIFLGFPELGIATAISAFLAFFVFFLGYRYAVSKVRGLREECLV